MNTQKMQFDLYGATIARMDDGNVYASLYVGLPVVNEKEENAKGISILKLSCDEEVYNSLNAPAYPIPVEADIRLKRAAGGRMGQHCVQLRVVKPAAPQSAPNKATGS